jgi:adenylylsulfate kinase
LQGVNVVVSTISLYTEIHSWNRINIPKYFEVFLDVPLDIRSKRDPKGIYANFFSGVITNVVGLDLNYQIPLSPDLQIKHNDYVDAEEISAKIFKELETRRLI